jgi:hypothetical protein
MVLSIDKGAHSQEEVVEPVISILTYLIEGEDDETGRHKVPDVNSELLEKDLREDPVARDARCEAQERC